MTSGGNNFNYFPENQLTKFKHYPPNFLIFVPKDFCDVFCVANGAFGRPGQTHRYVGLCLSRQTFMYMQIYLLWARATLLRLQQVL